VKEIKERLLVAFQTEIIQTLRNLKGVFEDLTRHVAELYDVLSNLKLEEGSLKVLNDEFEANVKRLKATLKFAQVEI